MISSCTQYTQPKTTTQRATRDTQYAIRNTVLTPSLDAPGPAQAGDNSYNYAVQDSTIDRDVETAVVSGQTQSAFIFLGQQRPLLAACHFAASLANPRHSGLSLPPVKSPTCGSILPPLLLPCRSRTFSMVTALMRAI
jgi:hypothetical protein